MRKLINALLLPALLLFRFVDIADYVLRRNCNVATKIPKPMGCFIQTSANKGKAKQIVSEHGAELVLSPEKFDLNGSNVLICVVENSMFDAAAIIYDKAERREFLRGPSVDDPRSRTWLSLPREKVLAICPDAKNYLS